MKRIRRIRPGAAWMGVLATSMILPWVSSCSTAQPDVPPAVVEAAKPNIIFILADDLGYGDLGCYGQQTIRTPHLDRLSSEGMRFTHHYAGSTVCAPSRCVLMTGLHAGHSRIRGNGRNPLLPEDETVAERLKAAGYTTGLIGKWGLGEPDTTGIPNRQGFDHWFGYLNQRHAHNYYPEYLWRNEVKQPLKNVVTPVNPPGGVATERIEYSHDLFAEEALAFLETHRDGPFFLYLALTIPHANNQAKDKGMEVPSYAPYDNQDWPDPQKGHAAMITRMDADIGRLAAKLKSLNIDEQTAVFFSSDNGPHAEGGADPEFFDSNGPLRGIKRDLYDGGIRVPLIARWPGRIPAGTESDHISAFWDFFPTFCDLADEEIPDDLDGISMMPTLTGDPRTQETHEYLYWEFHEGGKKQAVRMGPWKGVRLNLAKDPDAPIELYHVVNDPAESENLAEAHPDVVARIETILRDARSPSDRWPLP